MEYINLFLWSYGVFFAFVVLFGFAIQRNKERGYAVGEKIQSEEVTVLIPFRNEEKRLIGLLQSIQKLERLPYRFVFIDDHSDDASVALIENTLTPLNVPFEMLQMKGEKYGKKYALREAAKHVETAFTLTWDADITVPSDYFLRLEELSKADLYVLPALLTSENFVQRLFTFDVLIANAVNTGLAGWRRPIFASGANLLYRTECFEKYDSIDKHAHISSGDDTFLLRDFVQANADVRVVSSPSIAVKTPSPSTFKEYFQQRLRWVSKTNALGDPLNTMVAVVQLVFMLFFLAILVWAVVYGKWFYLLYLLICKMLTDLLVFWAYFKRIKNYNQMLILPLAELWFPIYSIALAALIPFYKTEWKGRTVVSK